MNRVREIRTALSLTQKKLAELAGVHPIQLLHIEKGRVKSPHPKTMRAIAEALGCGVVDAFPDAPRAKVLLAQTPAEILKDSVRLRSSGCLWCGRRAIAAQAAVLQVAGQKIYETGHLRCLAEYIIENTTGAGDWKKHRHEGLR